MPRVDLHTHSYGSPDGNLRLEDYRTMLEWGALDYIAITDHNTITAAQDIRSALGELGSRIIIGEEVTTTQGEIIGLYLSSTVPKGLSAEEAVLNIKKQGGLVYIPHPFETVRSGITEVELNKLVVQVDIVETYNGRAVFQDKGTEATEWATANGKPGATSSDSHGRRGWGKTYSVIKKAPTRENLASQLAAATYNQRRVGFGILYPKLNRLRKLFKLI